MVHLVVIFHRPDDLGHVVKFLAVLHFCPLVGPVGKILVVILTLVVIDVKEILKVVEPYDMALLNLLRPHGGRKEQDCGKGQRYAV